MTEEIWRAIPGYEGLYEASSLGRVRSIDRVVSTFSARGGKRVPLRRSGKVIAQSLGPHGYALACLSKDGRSRTRRVNRLICAAFYGDMPSKIHACHCDGDKNNNRSENLRWDTAQANQADRIRHGTALRGERVGTAKLNSEQIAAIRASRTFSDVAGDIPVSRTHYYRIKKGGAWTHI